MSRDELIMMARRHFFSRLLAAISRRQTGHSNPTWVASRSALAQRLVVDNNRVRLRFIYFPGSAPHQSVMSVCLLVAVLGLASLALAANPIRSEGGLADPHVHVWDDGTDR